MYDPFLGAVVLATLLVAAAFAFAVFAYYTMNSDTHEDDSALGVLFKQDGDND